MTTETATEIDLLILETGLFNDKEFLSEALQTLTIPDSQWRKLLPENMNDGDWDEILNLILSTRRVISL